ncbi:MAG: hypothetical protein U1F43_17270 [Myxococcota bacterium]
MAVATGVSLGALGLGAGALGLGRVAIAAEPAVNLPPPPAPPSSLETLASQIVKTLYGNGGPALAAGAPFGIALRFDKPPDGTRADALLAHLGDALEAALRTHAPAAKKPGPRVSDDTAAERIEVDLQVQAGHLAATARRRALPQTVWSALMAPDGQLIGTAFSNVPIDLEVRTLLGLGRRDVKLTDLRVVPVGKKSAAQLLAEPILDLAIGDFDGDAMPELAVLQPDGVRFVRWAKGGFAEELGVLSLRAVAPSRSRLRAPMGKLVPVVRADGRTVLVAASSDRAEPIVIGWGAGGPERLTMLFQKGWPLYATGVDRFLIAPWPEGTDVIDGNVTEARLGTAGANWLGPVGKVYDVRAFAFRDKGGAFAPVIMAAKADGDLSAAVGGAVQRVSDAGTVALWLDMDADGDLEALLTSSALSGPDRLSLARGVTPAAVPARWTGLAAAPVTAATAGDVDRDGFLEIVLATWNGDAADLTLVVPR